MNAITGLDTKTSAFFELSFLGGKINGPFTAADAAKPLGGEYGKIRTKMNADAWLYGTTMWMNGAWCCPP